ncbi:MAG: hypothetical protein A2583_07910 [Bdellovibrionales bacterium RIFOXYD1_FULL_53_11]|nr:MAG: hypothetical protein A2583_07910 [Bdellovibrionales bacterium RIFOXYD1_FULL_53_11]
MTARSNDIQQLLSRWVSLGIAFGRDKHKEDQDIEQTIIDTLPFLPGDLKLLILLLTWLDEMGDLIHLERIKTMAKVLPPTELAFLGAIAEFTKKRYRNWQLISAFARKKLRHSFSKGFVPELSERLTISVDMGQVEPDPAFERFRLRIPEIALSDKKKLIPRRYVLQDHKWFSMRALIGANWRADVAFSMLKDPGMNPYRIAKKLSCSYETAYRLKKALDESSLVAWDH